MAALIKLALARGTGAFVAQGKAAAAKGGNQVMSRNRWSGVGVMILPVRALHHAVNATAMGQLISSLCLKPGTPTMRLLFTSGICTREVPPDDGAGELLRGRRDLLGTLGGTAGASGSPPRTLVATAPSLAMAGG